MELQCGCRGNVTSSGDAQSKSVSPQLGVSLPKRAETFTAFDSKRKSSSKTLIMMIYVSLVLGLWSVEIQ